MYMAFEQSKYSERRKKRDVSVVCYFPAKSLQSKLYGLDVWFRFV